MPLDPELRWQIVHRLAETGAVDQSFIDAERARDGSAGGELGAATAHAAFPNEATKAEAWQAMMADGTVSNRMFEALAAGLWSPEQAELLRPYVARYFIEAPAVAERRGQAFSQVVGHAFPGLWLAPDQVTLLVEALAGDVPTVLRRVWDDRYDDVRPAHDAAGGQATTR